MIGKPKNKTWKPVRGFEGIYEVSSDGDIWSVRRNRLRKLQIHPVTGYIMVILASGVNKVNKYPHRLVCESFHPLSEFVGAHVNHKDGDKKNNHYMNLEWCTRSQNIIHGFKIGSIKSNLKGKILSLNSKAKSVVAIKDTAILEFGTVKECCEYIGGAYNYVCNKVVDSGNYFNGFLVYSK